MDYVAPTAVQKWLWMMRVYLLLFMNSIFILTRENFVVMRYLTLV